MATRLTVFMDPYGRFFLSDCRGAYPVEVEFPDGYQVLEDAVGKKLLVGPFGSKTDLTAALRKGTARII